MQKTLKTILVLIFGAFVVFIFCKSTNAGFYLARGTDNDQAPARDLFIRNCARCHGADGVGLTDLGRKLEVPDLREDSKKMSSAKITRIIANGRSDMPAFGKKLTKKQIASLAAYVRKL
jgi:mono/diheme cytochrome c family protein